MRVLVIFLTSKSRSKIEVNAFDVKLARKLCIKQHALILNICFYSYTSKKLWFNPGIKILYFVIVLTNDDK